MKNLSYGFILVLASLAAVVSCVDEPDVQFGLDTEVIEIGPEGGVRMLNVSSADNWIATVQEPWVTVSPANGSGTVECSISIDSALTASVREAVVRIENQVTKDRKEFTVRQNGFDWQIVLPEPEVTVADYAVQNERKFSVKVKTNVPFDVVLEEGADDPHAKAETYVGRDSGSNASDSAGNVGSGNCIEDQILKRDRKEECHACQGQYRQGSPSCSCQESYTG